jgi:hypothetical protein
MWRAKFSSYILGYCQDLDKFANICTHSAIATNMANIRQIRLVTKRIVLLRPRRQPKREAAAPPRRHDITTTTSHRGQRHRDGVSIWRPKDTSTQSSTTLQASHCQHAETPHLIHQQRDLPMLWVCHTTTATNPCIEGCADCSWAAAAAAIVDVVEATLREAGNIIVSTINVMDTDKMCEVKRNQFQI